jgi:ribosomal-protein-alanine N-acetyltransferase
MSQQILLETSRLQLRPFSPEDANALYLLNSDPLVLQYTGDVPFKDAGQAADFIQQYDHYRQFGYGRWAVIDRESSAFLGWCGLKYSPEKLETDIGFRFHRQYWGRGFATEASKVCLDYGFTAIGLSRIVGRAQAGNYSSHKVLEKIGMTQIGSFPDGSEQWLVYEKMKSQK